MPSALGEIRSLASSVYIPSVLFGIAQGAIVPVVALSARDLGASVATAAITVAIIGLGKIIGDVPAGWLVDRWNERRAMFVGTAVFVLGCAICLIGGAVWVIAVGAALAGLSTSVFGIARQAYVTDVVPYEMRGRAMSTLGGTQRIGLFAGPFLAAPTMSWLGTPGGYWTSMVMALFAALVLLFFGRPEPAGGSGARPEHSGPRAFVPLLRQHAPVLRTLGVGALLIGAARASRQAALPLWGDHIGLDPATTTLIVGISGAAEVVAFYPAGMIMDRFRRQWVVVPSMALLGASLVLLPLSGGLTGFVAVAGLMGLANGLGSGINMTVGSDVSPAVGRATFLGLWRLFVDVGNGLGPVLVGVVAGFSTLGLGVASAGVTAGVAAGMMGWFLPRYRSSGAAEAARDQAAAARDRTAADEVT
jgi:MFS family permease